MLHDIFNRLNVSSGFTLVLVKASCLLVIYRTLSLALGLLLLELEGWPGQPWSSFPLTNPHSKQGAPNAGEEKSQV